MLIGVATRKYARSVRLADGDLAGQARRATTKSSVSRRFVALSTAKLKEWLAADLSGLDLLVIQIDGLRVGDHVLVAAIGMDGAGDKHVLSLALGATENAAVVKALLADLVERGLRPDIARLFILDGAKALSRAVRDTFGDFALIQRCQVHKGRNIIERLAPSLHAGVKKVLRQAWDSPTAEQAERVLKNLARRLDHDAPGVSASILEGLDEMLTVIRLGLPNELRRSLSCTNAIESLMAVLRQVCRNVKHWRDARMALRWTATAMLEAEKSFRRLKAHKQLPLLRAALLRHQQALLGDKLIASKNLVA
jgi:transposase-like protein